MLKDSRIFPFSFGPKCENLRTIKVTEIGQDKIIIHYEIMVHFDHTQRECAPVALIKETKEDLEKKVKVQIEMIEGDLEEITVELKKGENNQKYLEVPVLLESPQDLILDLKEDTTEIVFCCWNSINENRIGTVSITVTVTVPL